jgi:hypothetical protein
MPQGSSKIAALQAFVPHSCEFFPSQGWGTTPARYSISASGREAGRSFGSCIKDQVVWSGGRLPARAGPIADHRHIDNAPGRHPRTGALLCPNGRRPAGIIPAGGRDGVCALFMAVAVALIFVKVEFATAPGSMRSSIGSSACPAYSITGPSGIAEPMRTSTGIHPGGRDNRFVPKALCHALQISAIERASQCLRDHMG